MPRRPKPRQYGQTHLADFGDALTVNRGFVVSSSHYERDENQEARMTQRTLLRPMTPKIMHSMKGNPTVQGDGATEVEKAGARGVVLEKNTTTIIASPSVAEEATPARPTKRARTVSSSDVEEYTIDHSIFLSPLSSPSSSSPCSEEIIPSTELGSRLPWRFALMTTPERQLLSTSSPEDKDSDIYVRGIWPRRRPVYTPPSSASGAPILVVNKPHDESSPTACHTNGLDIAAVPSSAQGDDDNALSSCGQHSDSAAAESVVEVPSSYHTASQSSTQHTCADAGWAPATGVVQVKSSPGIERPALMSFLTSSLSHDEPPDARGLAKDYVVEDSCSDDDDVSSSSSARPSPVMLRAQTPPTKLLCVPSSQWSEISVIWDEHVGLQDIMSMASPTPSTKSNSMLAPSLPPLRNNDEEDMSVQDMSVPPPSLSLSSLSSSLFARFRARQDCARSGLSDIASLPKPPETQTLLSSPTSPSDGPHN
ncbi:uncharacterized protein V1518DRAFT_415069 [Limtongia smithiae]|uniref:uncharacterized protein n=1 Tax=Limtongia smithiae TaxID=1125753 RepID=UPI0034CEBA25